MVDDNLLDDILNEIHKLKQSEESLKEEVTKLKAELRFLEETIKHIRKSRSK